MELLLDGILVPVRADAVVEAEMPATLVGGADAERALGARPPRSRPALRPPSWSASRPPGAAPAEPPRIAAADAVLDHLVPPLSVLVAATGGVAVAGTALRAISPVGRPRAGWGLVAALAGHVASGLVLARAPRSVYRSFVHAPRMVVWKVRLWVRMALRRGDVDWVRTARVGGGPSA